MLARRDRKYDIIIIVHKSALAQRQLKVNRRLHVFTMMIIIILFRVHTLCLRAGCPSKAVARVLTVFSFALIDHSVRSAET